MKETLSKALLAKILLSIIIAFTCNLMLYFSVSSIAIDTALSIKAYYYTFLISLMFVLSLTILLRKAYLFLILIALIIIIISICNYYTYMLHGTVLTIHELKSIQTAKNVIGSYRLAVTPNVISMCLMATGSIFLLRGFKSFLIQPTKGRALVPLCLLSLLGFIHFVYKVDRTFMSYEEVWSWESYYYRYGYIAGTISNVRGSQAMLRKPDNYDANDIVFLAGHGEQTDDYPDIILILNETWYDLDHYAVLETDVDYMPIYHSLDSCLKGYACVPISGGGTNDSEYELLTGNSISLLNVYSPYLNYSFNGYRSVVSYLESLGYTTMAAHPLTGVNYYRQYVWNDLGFDMALFEESFHDLTFNHNRQVATDSSVFENFISFYEDMPEDSPRFAFLLTIQNHGDWDSNPSEVDTVHCFSIEGMGDYDEQRINEYLSSVKLTDSFIEELMAYYKSLDRKVIVCMVGDHAPALINYFPGDSVQHFLRKRQVPYFIWANYEINYSTIVNKNIDLCAVTPIMFQLAGLPISPYYTNILALSESMLSFTNVTVPGSGYYGQTLGYMTTDEDAVLLSDTTDEGRCLQNYYFSEYHILNNGEFADKLYYPEVKDR